MAPASRPRQGRERISDDASLTQIDFATLPRHVAIIMDGNGRWARQRGLPRVAGHRAGIASVREMVETCGRLGLEALTLYAFSRENWSRPAPEVRTLMRLLCEYLSSELESVHARNVRFQVIGRSTDLPVDVQEALARAERRTADNTGMRFLVALSYSGRSEIADAARALARLVQQGLLDPESIDETAVESHLSTSGVPDPDLLIRTSGEMRVSNFLLWQIAYAELWVSPVLWPDFRKRHLYEAILDFQRRERRFGGVGGEKGVVARALKRLLT
ncbi:MAG: isoprenyl transferase [Acidobacteriota bacterium]